MFHHNPLSHHSKLLLCVTALLFAYQHPAWAWSGHGELIWPWLRIQPTMMEKTLPAEPLEDFLSAESGVIADVLLEHEQWARAHLESYKPRPDGLVFEASDPLSFLRAIRVNPTRTYAPYIQVFEAESLAVADGERVTEAESKVMRFSDLSFLKPGESTRHATFVSLSPGEITSVAAVLATASDEPDFGMDVGLFDDNGTDFGPEYGFGPQPFGDPKLDYGSQAPFHMGFYHLSPVIELAQPGLLETYPEWRVSLYRALASAAFATGHDYWGWRFTGWALHYVGDLTQPYHAEPLPGVSTFDAIVAALTGKTGEVIQLLSNRHGVLESFQYRKVNDAISQSDWQAPLLVTLTRDSALFAFDDCSVRDVVSAESVSAAGALDRALSDNAPWLWVSDPGFAWSDSGFASDVIARMEREMGFDAIDALEMAVSEQLLRFNMAARSMIKSALTQSETRGAYRVPAEGC